MFSGGQFGYRPPYYEVVEGITDFEYKSRARFMTSVFVLPSTRASLDSFSW